MENNINDILTDEKIIKLANKYADALTCNLPKQTNLSNYIKYRNEYISIVKHLKNNINEL